MDFRLLKRFFIPSVFLSILLAIFMYQVKNLLYVLFFKKKYFLLIGILSAPENFDKRVSIRKTWLQLLPEISASYYFIIGNQFCGVPPDDRIDPYSCIDLPITLPENLTVDTEFTTMKIQSLKSKASILDFAGFGFYVREPIIVKEIGILKSFIEAVDNEIQVQLISAIDNNILSSVTFSPEMINDSDLEIVTKTVKNINLTNGSEVYIKLKTNIQERKFYPNCSYTTWQFEPNVLHFINLWEEDGVVPHPFTDKSCSFVHLIYSILDVESIKEHVESSAMRRKEWKTHNTELAIKLNSESQTHNDLLFVDVTDAYRNLSKKMIEFYKKIASIESFKYILKCDDDSFIDLLRVYDRLIAVKNERDKLRKSSKFKLSKFWLWSYIKDYWKVQRAGKWREDHYLSASYPSFPCGGGYVINKGVVDYIVENEDSLHNFQGEDVSLGIWLSPMTVDKYKTPKTIPITDYNIQKLIQTELGKGFKKGSKKASESNLCQWTCDNKKKYNMPFCNKVQLDVKDMYKTWAEFTVNGFV